MLTTTGNLHKVNAQDKTYSLNLNFEGNTSESFNQGDVLTVQINNINEVYIYVNGTNVKTISETGSYSYTFQSGGTVTFDESRYTITIADGKVITVEGTTADGKKYDGTTTAVAHVGTVSGIADGDDVQVEINSAVFASKYVGNDIKVTISYKLTGEDASKYIVPANSETTADIDKRTVTLTSESATKEYDGTPLTRTDVCYGALAGGESFAIEPEASGTITKVGQQTNTIATSLQVKSGSVDTTANYEFIKDEGTLTVTPKSTPIVITTSSNTKTYDGAVIDAGTATSNFDAVKINGDTITIPLKYTGENAVKDAGVYKNDIATKTIKNDKDEDVECYLYQITDANGEDVTKCYTFAEPQTGTLTINKSDALKIYYMDNNLAVSSTEYGDRTFTFTYDGTTKYSDYLIAMYNGDETKHSITYQYSTDNGTNWNKYSSSVGVYLNNTDACDVTFLLKVEDKNYETVSCSIHFVVNKRNITLTSGTNYMLYDGVTTLTNSNIKVEGDGWAAGEGVTYNVTGSQKEKGSSKNTFTYTANEGTNLNNYNITKVEGDLIVEYASVDADKSANVNESEGKLSSSFNKGDVSDVVIDLKDTFSTNITAKLIDKETSTETVLTCEEGSVKITVPADFIDALSEGTHNYTLKVMNSGYDKYSYDLSITIKDTHKVASTGLTGISNTLTLVSLLSLTMGAGAIAIKKKKH